MVHPFPVIKPQMMKDVTYIADFLRSVRQNLQGLQSAIVELSTQVKADVLARPTFEQIQKEIILQSTKLSEEHTRLLNQVTRANPVREIEEIHPMSLQTPQLKLFKTGKLRS